MRLSDGEKLILTMLCEVYESMGIDREIDPKLVKAAITSGHTWGLKWEYEGILSAEPVSDDVRQLTVDVLDMWQFLEQGYNQLPPSDREHVDASVGSWKGVRFRGFDGNNETEYFSVADFLIGDLGRWQHFKGRDLNSHMPLVPTYRRMHERFKSMRSSLGTGRGLTANEIIQVLNA